MRAIPSPVPSKLVALALGCSILSACSTGGSDDYGFVFKGNGRTTEKQGSILIRIERDSFDFPFGIKSDSTSLDYTTESGTAESGLDFVPTSGTLAWGSGHGGDREFMVPIIDDSEVEGTEEFLIRFSNNKEPLLFANPVTIKIKDDDGGDPVQAGVTLTYLLEIGEEDQLTLIRLQTEGKPSQEGGSHGKS